MRLHNHLHSYPFTVALEKLLSCCSCYCVLVWSILLYLHGSCYSVLAWSTEEALSLIEALAPSDTSERTRLRSPSGPPPPPPPPDHCSTPNLSNSAMYRRPLDTTASSTPSPRGSRGRTDPVSLAIFTVLLSPSPSTNALLLKSSSAAVRRVSRVRVRRR